MAGSQLALPHGLMERVQKWAHRISLIGRQKPDLLRVSSQFQRPCGIAFEPPKLLQQPFVLADSLHPLLALPSNMHTAQKAERKQFSQRKATVLVN